MLVPCTSHGGMEGSGTNWESEPSGRMVPGGARANSLRCVPSPSSGECSITARELLEQRVRVGGGFRGRWESARVSAQGFDRLGCLLALVAGPVRRRLCLVHYLGLHSLAEVNPVPIPPIPIPVPTPNLTPPQVAGRPPHFYCPFCLPSLRPGSSVTTLLHCSWPQHGSWRFRPMMSAASLPLVQGSGLSAWLAGHLPWSSGLGSKRAAKF